ncbi:MAG: DUF5946 family protein [Acidothermus sp.]|nr:DUF5946 family protein [Acidothermus sp.]
MHAATVTCPGCGAVLPDRRLGRAERSLASGECLEKYGELTAYTLAKGDIGFIHQVVVDTYAAQHAGGSTKPITVVFALVGLCLVVERGYTGRQVQRAHMALAKRSGKHSPDWPRWDRPPSVGTMTVHDVLKAAPGDERDGAIRRWAEDVWNRWAERHGEVRNICDAYGL